MGFSKILGPVLGLAAALPAFAGEPPSRAAKIEEYLGGLRALVASYAKREADLAAWARAAGLEADADAALGRARACSPGLAEPPPAKFTPSGQEPKAGLAARIFGLRAATARDYAALARSCQENGLLFECRRSVGRALSWDPRNEEAKRLAAQPSVKGGSPSRARKPAAEGVWLGERWVALPDYRKSAEARLRFLIAEKGKATGLAFQGDFLPGLDILYTTPAEERDRAKEALERYLAYVQGRFFLSHAAKPLQFYLLRGPEELAKLGVNPMLMGAYEWGKGRLYEYPNPMGTGTVLHEMTHALLEANFKTFPPLWMNEGLACFFETAEDLGAEEPFGCLNWRDEIYAKALAAGKARSLEALFRDCSFRSIDMEGYAQGRTLMNWLWTQGQLEAFVIAAQLSGPGAEFGSVLSGVLGKSVPEIGREVEAFARGVGSRPPRIERGRRADESIDAPLGDGPEPEGAKGGTGK